MVIEEEQDVKHQTQLFFTSSKAHLGKWPIFLSLWPQSDCVIRISLSYIFHDSFKVKQQKALLEREIYHIYRIQL